MWLTLGHHSAHPGDGFVFGGCSYPNLGMTPIDMDKTNTPQHKIRTEHGITRIPRKLDLDRRHHPGAWIPHIAMTPT